MCGSPSAFYQTALILESRNDNTMTRVSEETHGCHFKIYSKVTTDLTYVCVVHIFFIHSFDTYKDTAKLPPGRRTHVRNACISFWRRRAGGMVAVAD
jgi:hypothetical protein